MPFFIELAADEFGNRLYTDSVPRIIEAERADEHLIVTSPGMDVFPYPRVHPRNWIECAGPARKVSHSEREIIIVLAMLDRL